jgi:hypothetical protein
MRAAFAFFELGPPSEEAVRALLTDDFVYQDRRRGLSFEDCDADSFPKYVQTPWNTGATVPPRFELETLAVRGERFAAVATRADYNGMLIESIEVVALDPTLRLVQRTVDFDRDDVDRAIAELDRLDSQAEAD